MQRNGCFAPGSLPVLRPQIHDAEWTETVEEDKRAKLKWATAMNPEDCALGMTIENAHLCAVRGEATHGGASGSSSCTLGSFPYPFKLHFPFVLKCSY